MKRFTWRQTCLLTIAGLSVWLAAPATLVAQVTPEQSAFFEKNIRPVLVRECYSCHSSSATKLRAKLNLETREGTLKGGETGPAVVPGDLEKSLLLKAIKHSDPEFTMPPKKKLDNDIIANFEKWIAMGAPDPRDAPAKSAKYEIDIPRGRKFWSFQPVKTGTVPTVKNDAWPRSDIDRFLLAEMEAKGITPVKDADARTLVRRLYFDLIGLPPTPEQVDAFVNHHAARPQEAVAETVDRLLAMPQYGERWARHWLDVARYAESTGRSTNFAYPHAWRYRDYTIAAFNDDRPYDQFIREQLAGDLLPARDDKQRAEFMIATGFLAIGPKSLDERSRPQFLMDVADEQIDTTFQAFQGLTVACARCHDHKFDPIPQKDYYALAGIFKSTETCYGTVRLLQANHPSPLLNLPRGADVPVPLEPLTAEKRTAINKQIDDVKEQMTKLTGQNAFIQRILLQNRVSLAQSQLALYDSDGTPKPLAMGVREGKSADSRLYVRGELSQPGELVKRGFPQVLTSTQPSLGRGSGRLELANWIASKENPLTARVMANRVWLHLIGRGIVATPDNFGANGLPPSHPALLDHLAGSFVDNGWSVKKLIRTITLSRAYQLSAQFDKKNFDSDPDNVLVWRLPKRRLEADTMLSLAGRLDLAAPKGSAVQRRGEGNVAGIGGGGFKGKGAGTDPIAADTHRTVYLSIIRDSLPEMLTLFDFPDPSLIIGERATTTIPAQSLFMMNNPFVIRQAEGLADRVLAVEGDDAARLKMAYQLCYSRLPFDSELATTRNFLETYGAKQTRRATWTALCQSLFATAEFSHR
jgi:hypothetical protein